MVRKAKPAPAPIADPTKPARDRLLKAGAFIFASEGYGGASVRRICEIAGTSSNMIHHYFGSKQGLYDEILAGFTENVLNVPMRIISEPARSRENLVSRLEIFIAETLEALIAHQELFRLVIREQVIFDFFGTYDKQLVQFIEAAKKTGLVRAELDTEMLTGLILDRLGNQILYASWIKETSGANIETDGPYKKRWLSANIDLIMNGIMAEPSDSKN